VLSGLGCIRLQIREIRLPRKPLPGTWVNKDKERAGVLHPGPRVVSGGFLAAYGNPTIDFSVASVTLVSMPSPPSRESLPFTPSLELSESLPSPP
jgi:hypothetical protein